MENYSVQDGDWADILIKQTFQGVWLLGMLVAIGLAVIGGGFDITYAVDDDDGNGVPRKDRKEIG